MHGHRELLADGPEGIVFRVVIGLEAPPHGREQDALEPVLARFPRLLHGELDVPVDGDAGEPDAPLGRRLCELGAETVVGIAAGPHQLAVRAIGPHREAGAEGRRVHLGHAVREEHFGGDPVVVDDLVAGDRVPRARELVVAAAPPFFVDLGDEEVVAHALCGIDLDRERRVEGGAVFRVDVGAVVGGAQSDVAIGRDDEVAVHWGFLQQRDCTPGLKKGSPAGERSCARAALAMPPGCGCSQASMP